MDYNRQTPINFFSEDFIAGFQPSNRMSVVRRFFCLFVTFDVIFVMLLWLICIVINGENIYKALQEQILGYNIKSSLFDIVGVAVCRFLLLTFFYGVLQISHWIIIAVTTSLSCGFLITKVFYYEWPLYNQPFLPVLLIIISFVLSWFEAWFLDSRMIPQEEYSRTLTNALRESSARETTPLLAPFLRSVHGGSLFQASGSLRQSFYSPVESVADNEENEEENYKQIGLETVIKAYELLESKSWKIEKVTQSNDIIYTTTKSIGKLYKLRAKVDYCPKKLLYELFYKIEDVPSWNPTILESKIIKKIDDNTDISYSVSMSGAGGIIKSRDFVNLRCWKLMNDSRVIESSNVLETETINHSINDGDFAGRTSLRPSVKSLQRSVSDLQINETSHANHREHQLSQSLNSVEINITTEDVSIAQVDPLPAIDHLKDIFVSAAVSIDYFDLPPTTKYIRGNNMVSCWAMRPVEGDCGSSVFEWVMCIDLKGSLPKYILNSAYITMMTDYMTHLRTHIRKLNEQSGKYGAHSA